MPRMKDRIDPASEISTDGWKAYSAIARDIGCTHKVVNHYVEFKTGPDSLHPGTHTNHVEVSFTLFKRNKTKSIESSGAHW